MAWERVSAQFDSSRRIREASFMRNCAVSVSSSTEVRKLGTFAGAWLSLLVDETRIGVDAPGEVVIFLTCSFAARRSAKRHTVMCAALSKEAISSSSERNIIGEHYVVIQ